MKKVLSLLLAMVMVFSMIPVAAFAADTDPTITFTTDFSTELERGETFTVTATLTNNPGIASFTNTLKWNETVLSFVGFELADGYTAEDEDAPANSAVFADNIIGVGSFTYASASNKKGNGMLYSAIFRINETGSGDLGLGLRTTVPGKEFTFANADEEDITPQINTDAIDGLMFGGPGMPENAPFTAITTDSEESPFVNAIVPQGEVSFNYSTVPYYVVYIPEDATTAYVTAPDQVVMEVNYDTGEMKATAYAADMTGAGTDTDPWSQLYISYDYEMVGEEVKVEVPLNMTYADWSGDVELCFVGDENGAATHAFGIEDAGNACLGLISFSYSAPPSAITIQEVEGCTIYALNKYDEEVTQAAPGEIIRLEYDVEDGYEVTDIQVTCGGEAVALGDMPLRFEMPEGDVEITAICVAKQSEFAISKAADLTNGAVKAMVSNAEVQKAAAGTEITLEVNAAEGYRLAEGSLTVTKDGVTGEAAKVTVTDNKFTMPANAVTITASFVKETYPVSGTGKVEGGTVTAKAGDTVVPEAGCAWGETVTVEATPDEGYELTALTYTAGTNEPVDIKGTKTFVMPAESVTITAAFTRTDTTTYSITAAAAENGTVKAMVSGTEVEIAAEGTEITVEVIPAEGYQLEEGSLTVTKDGITGEEAKVVVVDNKFTMPANSVTIAASFIPGHTCTYDQQKVDDKYLKTEATCESAAVYYKSCTCGEFDNSEAAETFTSGSVVPHNYANEDGTCQWCRQANPLVDIKINLDDGAGDIDLHGIALNLTSGENMLLDLSFENPSDVANLITWISTDENIAKVIYNVAKNAFELIPGTAGTATISLYDNNDLVATAADEENQTPTPLATFTVTVEEAPVEVEGYSITMDADKPNQMVGEENISVSLKVNHNQLTIYNSYKLELTYDPAVVTLATKTNENSNIHVSDNNGAVIITRYGTALTTGTDDIVLTFEAVAPGNAEVRLTKAYISDSDAALTQDAVAASIIDGNEVVEAGTTVITVAGYDVDLTEDFSSEQKVLKPGESLQFTSNIAPYYDYTVIVKVQNSEGEWTTLPAEALTGTGTAEDPYTVAASYIDGNISVESSEEKTGKFYNVTIKNPTEDATAMAPAEGYEIGENKAQYMNDRGYKAVFTPNNTEQYEYTVSVSVGGAPYTCTPEGGVYTIPGADIKGDIVFTVTVSPKQVNHTVTITGSGAGDVVQGTAAQTVANGANYTFNLKMTQSYDYTVTATMGGTGVTPAKAETANEDGSFTYTIENVTAALEIVIEKSNLVVEVSEYLDLNGRTMFLITATKTLNEGQSLSYKGNTMFYSQQYEAWTYLVIVGENETLDAAEAKADITVGDTKFITIPVTLDVNMSNFVDINDAQLVYDMYGAKKYTDLTQVGIMEKLLRADTAAQGDSAKKLDVHDARAVVPEALK